MTVKAIRIDRASVIVARADQNRHLHLLIGYMQKEGLSEDQADEMINSGRIEFGDAKVEDDKVEFVHDGNLNDNYRTVDKVRRASGWGGW